MTTTTERDNRIRAVLAESRNGMNFCTPSSPFTPRLLVSDGAQELILASGCHWLVMILATELEPKLLRAINEGEITTVLVELNVQENGSAILCATYADDAPPFWSKALLSTSFPPGEWVLFEVGAFEWDMQAERAKNIIATLLSEH